MLFGSPDKSTNRLDQSDSLNCLISFVPIISNPNEIILQLNLLDTNCVNFLNSIGLSILIIFLF